MRGKMKFIKFFAEGKERWGYLKNGKIVEIALSNVVEKEEIEERGKAFENFKVLPPFFGSKIVCLGLNYRSHVKENKTEMPKNPILFSKAITSLISSKDPVMKPKVVERLDYEVELVFVISKKAKKVGKEECYDYIFGYTIMNDISARDLQFSDKQWFRSKSCDTFCPLGPCIADKAEIKDPMSLDIEMRVNGNIMQKANTEEMIFDIPYILEFVTETITLLPGDIVATGTPAGVGVFRKPHYFLKDGDVMEANIEGIGKLENAVIFEK